MIGKFATASVLLLLILTTMLGGRGFAQATPSGESPSSPAPAPQQPPAQQPATQPPAGQQPATQQPAAPPTAGEQEATEEETSSSRRKKPHDYKNWSYNVGAGANIDGGTTHTFVRGGGVVGNAGVARNGNKYLGLRADFIFANLPLRDSSLQLAQAGALQVICSPLRSTPSLTFPSPRPLEDMFCSVPVITIALEL